MSVTRSDSIAALAAALAKAQGQFTAAKFDAVNPFLKNKYASLGSIIETAKPIMAANGLSVTQPVTGDGTSIGVTTLLMHSSGEWIESTMSLPLVDERGKSQSQAAGSVITYLRRYALASTLGLYADADVDGSEPAQGKQEKAPAGKPAQPEPPASLMTIEMALAVVGSDGKTYNESSDKDLAGKLMGINTALKNPDLDPVKREQYLYKRDAVLMIQGVRATAPK